MMIRKIFNRKPVVAFAWAFAGFSMLHADEGMWLPLLLDQNEAEMQRMGLQLKAEDIYSINHSSLKDAVVIFGGGCTGEVVSDQGLVLTNHHCGYSAIQYHSSVEHDYLTYGFWAGNFEEELPCPGLEVRFLKEMRDVSGQILAGLDEVSPSLSEQTRKDSIQARADRLSAPLEKEGYEVRIVPFYYGNQYYMFIYEVFRDVRLVGTPPSNIGKFGGDTDNWMWPRHTGDFSVFRIYADENNRPAPYSPSNRPYVPKHHLKIDLRGYEEGDFTFVVGYPGSTQEYITSYAVRLIQDLIDPMRISARTERLDIIKAAMDRDPKTRIQYASKAAGIANGWKKWQGEVKGIRRLNVVGSKQDYETVFQDWCQSVNGREFTGVLPALEKAYQDLEPYLAMQIIFQEHTLAPEAVSFAYSFTRLRNVSTGSDTSLSLEEALASCRERADRFFKDYDPVVDRRIFERLAFMEEADGTRTQVISFPGNTLEKQLDWFYGKSVFTSQERMEAFLDKYKASSYKALERDPLFKYAQVVYGQYFNQVYPFIKKYNERIDSLQRIYMRGQIKLKESGDFASLMRVGVKNDIPVSNVGSERLYPDANFTMRVAYGQVKGFKPADAVQYAPYTTLSGIMEKENPDVYDYVVEAKLKDLYARKDYGPYANALGEMPVAFIGTNHTTGGNSGSPVLNGDGYLMGINFDRNWEGTMSDIRYDAGMCRNIMLDIRYCLFIIDKFAGATRLIDEMDILYPLWWSENAAM